MVMMMGGGGGAGGGKDDYEDQDAGVWVVLVGCCCGCRLGYWRDVDIHRGPKRSRYTPVSPVGWCLGDLKVVT